VELEHVLGDIQTDGGNLHLDAHPGGRDGYPLLFTTPSRRNSRKPPGGAQRPLTTGARGLRSIMEGILLDTMFDLPGLEGVEKVVISRDVVKGTSPPLYIYSALPSNAGASAS
jgi:hypothetical protein